MGKHRYTVIAAGIAASAVFVYLAVRHLDLSKVGDIWQRTDLLPWLPIGVASYLAGHVVRGQRCRLLVRREASLGLVMASNIVVVGYASNNVFPVRLGEFVRAGMLAERTGMPVVQSLAVTFIERVLDGLAILLLLVIATLAGDTPGWIHQLVVAAVVLFGIATAVILFGVFAPSLVVAAASRLTNRLAPRFHDRAVSLASSIVNAGACLRDPRDAALLALYSVAVWALEAGLYIALMPVFGLSHDLRMGVVAMSVTSLAILVPSSPGFIGTFHFFCARVLTTYGVDSDVAISYATLVHLAFYAPITLWGAAAMLWYGVEVGSTAAIARDARKAGKTAAVRGVSYVEISDLPPRTADAPASAFTIALTEAVVVAEGRVPDAAAVAHTAAFVEGEMAALPPKLRLMLHTGMTFFRLVTRLRYLRGYCQLSLATRQRWTNRWAENRVAVFRQLIKPVRATAVLAYYDHDAVRRAIVGAPVAAPLVPAARLVRVEADAS